MAFTKAAAIVCVICLVACHHSGRWTDDPKNFERAWGQPLPNGVRVVHSWYWRSAHFTREEAYYFEFAPHAELGRSFVAENKMQPVANSSALSIRDYSCFDRPYWFAPRPLSEYAAWVTVPNASPALLLQDRETGELFVSVCQI